MEYSSDMTILYSFL